MDTEATESSSCSKNCTEDASSLFNCKICWQLAEDPVVTQCGHLFCWFCLCSWLKSFSKCKECPVCRAIIEEDNLVPLYGTESERKEAKDLDPNSEKSIPNRPMAQDPHLPHFLIMKTIFLRMRMIFLRMKRTLTVRVLCQNFLIV